VTNAACLEEAPPPKPAVLATPSARPRRRDVISSYDLGVEPYEQLWGPVILPAATALIPRLRLTHRSVVLDVGAGTGALVPTIRATAPEASVLALDASIEMLRAAHFKRRVPVARADAMALPVRSSAVDAVVMAYVLFHLAGPLAALKEANRVLRLGGRVGTVTWACEWKENAQRVWDDSLAEAGVPAIPARRVDDGLDNIEAIDGLFRTAGFAPERVWSKRLRHRWDPESFYGLATGSGVSRQRLALVDPDRCSSLLERFWARLRQLEPEDFRWEGEVICGIAAKPL
jgi:SAM-dependent methyltransferase